MEGVIELVVRYYYNTLPALVAPCAPLAKETDKGTSICSTSVEFGIDTGTQQQNPWSMCPKVRGSNIVQI
jgi:hypothetical protein